MGKIVDRDINARIKAVCDCVYGGNVTQMAKSTYISRTTLISLMKEDGSAPGYDVLRKIVEISTVNISERWLLTGEGEMFWAQQPPFNSLSFKGFNISNKQPISNFKDKITRA